MMMTKMIRPITAPAAPDDPTTKSPNARTMRPSKAAPRDSISLVDETLSASPNTVTSSSKVGKLLNSAVFRAYSTIRTTSRLMPMLSAMPRSSSTAGSGMSSISTATHTNAAATRSPRCRQPCTGLFTAAMACLR